MLDPADWYKIEQTCIILAALLISSAVITIALGILLRVLILNK